MYADYLAKVAMKKQTAGQADTQDANMEIDEHADEQREAMITEYEMEEEIKEGKSKTMKTGEKYIIRKLIAFKITIPKIDDYINKLSSLQVKDNSNKPSSITNQFSPNTMSNMPTGSHTTSNTTVSDGSQIMKGFQNHYFRNLENTMANEGSFKTIQGYNDDSQIAYQSQPSLFQPQMMPIPRINPMMWYNNQLMN